MPLNRRIAGLRSVTATAVLLIALCFGPAYADNVPPAGRGMEAVARLFVIAYHLPGPVDIELNSTAEPPWSEARLKSPRADLFISRREDADCQYDLGRTIVEKQNGEETIGIGEHIASITFSRLSGEIETRPGHSGYVDLTVFGLPGAVCDHVGRAGKLRCWDKLATALMSDEVRPFVRALHFVFENVCKPAELPLGR